MDREITVTGNSITAKNKENNRLIINGAVYSSNDPVLLKWEAVYNDTHDCSVCDTFDCSISSKYRVRRNSAGSIYVERQYYEEPYERYDLDYTRKDWHILLLDDFSKFYQGLLEEEQERISQADEGTIELEGLYVHYNDEKGVTKHVDRLPPLEVILNAREDESAPCIKDSGMTSPTGSSIVLDLFLNDPQHEGLLNWVCYNQEWYEH